MKFSFGKRGKSGIGAKRAALKRFRSPAKHGTVEGPTPDPFANLVLADIVLRAGSALVRNGVERALVGRAYSPEKAKDVIAGRSLRQSLVGAALARVASRSVPGAIVVGGGMIAKTLYDRHRDSSAARKRGKKALDRQAKRGK